MEATLSVWVILYFIIAHWIADFVLQSDDMAINKSKSVYWLSLHVFVYTLAFGFAASLHFGQTPRLVWFVGANAFLHFATDFITSKINAWLYNKSRHYFFVMIGFDQFLHYAAIFLTYSWAVS